MIASALILTLAAAQATPPVPRAPLERLISADDYPAAARAAGASGTTRVELIVAPTGRVAACRILVSSGTALLDAATCRLLASRARFTPASDTNGNPMESRFEGEIAWRPQG